MIRAAETHVDLERWAEICNAVRPEDPVALERLGYRPLPASIVVRGSLA